MRLLPTDECFFDELVTLGAEVRAAAGLLRQLFARPNRAATVLSVTA